jgi:hypothetical protein
MATWLVGAAATGAPVPTQQQQQQQTISSCCAVSRAHAAVLLCACFCLWQPSSITSECLSSHFSRGGIVARRHVTFCPAPAQQLWLVHHGHLAGGSCSNWRSCANADWLTGTAAGVCVLCVLQGAAAPGDGLCRWLHDVGGAG